MPAEGAAEFPSPPSRTNRFEYIPVSLEPMDIEPDLAVSADDVIWNVAHPIIMAESPIEENYLLKLYCRQVNIKRLSEQKRSRLVPKLRRRFQPEAAGEDFVTYWAEGADRDIRTYRVSDDPEVNRPIDCVPYIEISNAIIDAIGINGSLQSDNAVMAVSRTLGFNRTGAKINERIGAVLRAEIEAGRIKESNGRITL